MYLKVAITCFKERWKIGILHYYYNLKLVDTQFEIRPFRLTTLVYSAELLTDFSHTNFTVNYRDALDRLRVLLNIILL